MNALLLAAGEGSRLRPLTSKQPKPMLPIGGTPILERNVRWLVAHGVTDIVVNVHHLPTKVTDYFGDGKRFQCRIHYSHENALLGTAGALRQAQERFGAFNETFIVMYGDNLTDCALDRLLALHFEKRGLGTLALFEREDVLASGIVSVDENARITRFLEKPRPDQIFSRWVNAGIMVLENAVLRYIPAGASDFGRDILPAILQQGDALYGYRMKEHLWWIDSLADYRRTNREFEALQDKESLAE